ncbi:MAG: UDP-N-acetylmuramoyl-tripeptide--D-alanyl-D-alanine ligase [Eubacteriaceae bacterium]|nr:UDP-N-acetylmuramoyl-tripeptide--D-alanyl-D-alanine ligase [Eubacteriaceae bacterium]
MKEINIGQIKNATNGEILFGDPGSTVISVAHDSRKTGEKDLFFALTGDNHDGHDFIGSAIEAGCRNLVVSHMDWADGTDCSSLNIVKTEDTRKALQDLACWYIKEIGAKVIGVTGSTGKTSTKDMIYYVCSQKYRTGRTIGNYNNDIGMPLTVLGFNEDVQVAVLEMGMDHFGEIDLLAGIAEPEIGVITNIGKSHIENLGSRENIMKAKLEITDRFDEHDTLVISTGEDLLRKENIKGNFGIVTTGTETDNDYVITEVRDTMDEGLSFFLQKGNEKQKFSLPVHGKHNALNGALAVATGGLLGIGMASAACGLETMELTEGRLTVRNAGSISVIDDTYNASPDSVKAALDVLASSSGKKTAILGDMYELGKDARQDHEKTGEYAAALDIDMIIAVGEKSESIAAGAGKKGIYFRTKDELEREIDRLVPDTGVVLVKGSRGMKMETIVKRLIDRGAKE